MTGGMSSLDHDFEDSSMVVMTHGTVWTYDSLFA